MQRVELAVILTVVIAAAATAQSDETQGPRTTHAVGYYDATLQRVVLVGGADEPRAADRDHVWSWTGTRWESMTDSGPTARGNAGAAYDARRRLAIVTGGAQRSANDSTFETISDTWEGKPNGWQRISGTDVEPRDHQSLVYDEDRETVLMFGGILGDRSAAWPADTWEMRQEGWVRIATEGPVGRGRTALVYDTVRRQIVLFGGIGAPPTPGEAQPFFNDTWVWGRTNWRKVAEDGPPARYAHGMVFDEGAGVVLLYSGAAAPGNTPLSDMWQWDGSLWTEIQLSGPTPGYRYQPVMVYDRARGKTVLYGGILGSKDDTWEWDGRQWRQIRP
jgi:hypothetical protein